MFSGLVTLIGALILLGAFALGGFRMWDASRSGKAALETGIHWFAVLALIGTVTIFAGQAMSRTSPVPNSLLELANTVVRGLNAEVQNAIPRVR